MRYPLIVVLLVILSCSSEISIREKDSIVLLFDRPKKVVISGYAGDIMEPFISRNGYYLFFNNLNEPSVNTNIFYAEKINDTLFQFRGEVEGVNSPVLDGVPSLDSSGNFYFVSVRSYAQSSSTIYHGKLDSGKASGIDIVPGISKKEPGIVNFDAEISADGNTLYFVDGRFNERGQPQTADLVMAIKTVTGFKRLDRSADVFKAINTEELEYAAGLSADELILFFTRVPSVTAGVAPRIFYATRENKNSPFNKPIELAVATGFVEAATTSGDSLVYYHKKESQGFCLYCIRRKMIE